MLLVLLVIILLGGLPVWDHSREWGYGPGISAGTLLLIVLVLVILGRI